jgi:hypothetical protein
MLEEEFQTAETKPGNFPWIAPISLAIAAFVVGVASAVVLLHSHTIGTLQSVGFVLLSAILLSERCTNLRRAVRAWQLHYGKSVEYVARRVRESEDGLRFKAP